MIFSRLYFVSISFLVAISALLFHLNPDNFLADDAYFYPQIASEIVKGHGSTFHQYSETNGYHPLWMVVNVFFAFVAAGNKELLLHLLGAVQLGLYGISVYFLYKIHRLEHLRFLSIPIIILTILMLTVGGLRLFEAHLSIALQLGAFYFFLRFWDNAPSLKALAACSALLGLIFLARTDTFFLSFTYSAALALIVLKSEVHYRLKIARIAAIALPAILMAALYMGFNKIQFGHFVPISGTIKSTFPHMNFHWDALGMQGRIIVPLTLLSLTAAIFLCRQKKGLQTLFSITFFAILLHALYIAAFSWGSQWHYTIAFSAFPLALQAVLTKISEKVSFRKTFSASIFAISLVAFTTMVFIGVLKVYYTFSISLWMAGKESLIPSEKSPRLYLVDKINRKIPPGSGIAVFDSPGVLAYLTHARILPIDGLVNDRAYDEAILKEGFLEFLQSKNIHYFIAPDLPEDQEYRSSTLHLVSKDGRQINTVYTPLRKEATKPFELLKSDVFFFGPNPIPGAHNFSRVACWKL